jgi:hypothetical protein
VRRLVARDLGEERRTEGPDGLFDLGETSGSDVAAEKQRYIGEAIEAGH